MPIPTFATVINQLNTFIVANGNNEITANVLNPILKIIVDFANNSIGDLSTLTTDEDDSIVNSLNSLQARLNDTENDGVKLFSGFADPNLSPPSVFNFADFYMQLSFLNNQPVELFQFNGFEWVSTAPPDLDGFVSINTSQIITGNKEFTKAIKGVNAVNENELVTKSQLSAKQDRLNQLLTGCELTPGPSSSIAAGSFLINGIIITKPTTNTFTGISLSGAGLLRTVSFYGLATGGVEKVESAELPAVVAPSNNIVNKALLRYMIVGAANFQNQTLPDNSFALKSDLGNKENLSTTIKTNLVAAINELFNGKEDTANKSNSISDIASTTKFPVWKAVSDWVISLFQNSNTITATTAGTSTAYIASLTPPLTAYVTGQQFNITAHTANTTTTPTVNFDGLGAKNIVDKSGNAIAVGDLSGSLMLRYDGTNFRIVGGGGGSAGVSTFAALTDNARDNTNLNSELNTLGSAISSEASTRQAGDTTLTNNLNTEITNRQNADTAKLAEAKAYADLVATDVLRYAGTWDASVGAYPTTGTGANGGIRRGDTYEISVVGTIDGNDYEIGDQLRAKTATPGQVTANWNAGQTNTQQATTTRIGISRMATSTEAIAGSSTLITLTPESGKAMVVDEKKSYEKSVFVKKDMEMFFPMRVAGQIASVITDGLANLQFKVGFAGTYVNVSGTINYTAFSRVYFKFTYTDALSVEGSIILIGKDN